VDTGGISGVEQGIDKEMASQSIQAIDEASVCLLLVDAKHGLTPDDEKIFDYLRRSSKKTHLVVNKVDGTDPDLAVAEFQKLGTPSISPITATQGRGVKPLMQDVLQDDLFEIESDEPSDTTFGSIKIAVAGRPNVGKSTLVNRMLGEERVVVYDQPGTTRDSLYIPFERRGKKFTLIDTAGIRKRGKTKQVVEKFSVVKSLQAIRDSNVVVFLIDARDGIVEQDLHLLGYVIESGRALVIAINKWDGMEHEEKALIKSEIQRRLIFVEFATIHFISALHGSGVGKIYESIQVAHGSAKNQLPTSMLTQILQGAVKDHAPPVVNGRRIRLRYAHAGGKNPPRIIIHGKQCHKVPKHYIRYLEKTFRNALKLEGTPVRIEMKSDDNPYIKIEDGLSQQKVARKRQIKNNRQYLKR
tara:strand:+ start:1496 stop:2737 length:1242 start_codon:yes stop_codon:yes gene_type:complete